MKISVITATYNRASTIVRAISSIKSQTYSNIQTVIVDGASEDNTIRLLTKLLSSDDIVVSEPDNGIYDALNKGLKLSSGDILEFLPISNKHRDTKKSFVLVTDKVSFDEVPEELSVVPTIQEAKDIIEMEEIERDLDL